MYIHTYISIHTLTQYTYIQIYIYIYIYTYLYLSISLYIYIHMYRFFVIFMCTCIYILTYIYIYTDVVHTYIYIYVHVYMYICMDIYTYKYIFIYIYTHTLLWCTFRLEVVLIFFACTFLKNRPISQTYMYQKSREVSPLVWKETVIDIQIWKDTQSTHIYMKRHLEYRPTNIESHPK